MNGTSTQNKLVPEVIICSLSSSAGIVLQTISGSTVELQDSNAISDRFPPADYYAVVSFAGALNGSIYIAVNEGLAFYLTSRMAMLSPEDINQDIIKDCIKEITNQVTGKFRTVMSEFGNGVKISTPEISEQPPEVIFSDYDSHLSHSHVFKLNKSFMTVTLLASYGQTNQI